VRKEYLTGLTEHTEKNQETEPVSPVSTVRDVRGFGMEENETLRCTSFIMDAALEKYNKNVLVFFIIISIFLKISVRILSFPFIIITISRTILWEYAHMVSVEQIIGNLKEKSRPDQLAGMSRFRMSVENRLGVSVPELRKLAKQIGKNHQLALDLWETGIADARILASMIDMPEKLTDKQMEDWVKDFDSWDVCDQVCMNLFDKHPLAWKKIGEWANREEEFVKRAGYTLIACLALHDKKAKDDQFIQYIPIIKDGVDDDRNFVKKAVSWALRNIGKRNRHLNQIALQTAKDISQIDSKTANWIAKDVTKDLTSAPTKRRLTKKDQK
jgi:3-methyladenine DNA glycosylase AlkD